MRIPMILADDLTGALDSAVHFAKHGYRAVCKLNAELEEDLLSSSVPAIVVFNSNSRNESPERLDERLTPYIEAVRNAPFLFKKIDSTLRGHIGLELELIMEKTDVDAVLLAPAYVEAGRIVRDGTLFVHGVPLQQTEVAKDLPKEGKTSSVPERVAFASRLRPVHFDRSRLQNEGKLAAELASLLNEGSRVFTFDTVEPQDFEAVIRAGRHLQTQGKKVLWCGSAGFSKALAADMAANPPSPPALPPVQPPALWVIGSRKELAYRQVEELTKISNALVLHLPVREIYEKQGQINLDASLWEQMKTALAQHRHLIVQSSADEDFPDCEPIVAHGLVRAAREILFRFSSAIRCIVSVGGDTGTLLFRQIGGDTIHILGEIDEAVPYGWMFSRHAQNRYTVVTKGGSIGNPFTFLKIYDWMVKGGTNYHF